MFCGSEYSTATGDSMSLSTTSWGSQDHEVWSSMHSFQPRAVKRPVTKASSELNLMMHRSKLQDAMEEFRRNGSDEPYEPDEPREPRDRELQRGALASGPLSGMGPSSTYLRQWSCPLPAPSRSPRAAPARPARSAPPASWPPRAHELLAPPPPGFANVPAAASKAASELDLLTDEQRLALNSLFMYSLLKDMDQSRGDQARGDHVPLEHLKKRQLEECRFCKNNGERETVCRSHVLKDARGRVRCPILRAYVCRRCGASGDNAHTIKYCPFSTTEDRKASIALMKSLRKGSVQRRYSSFTPSASDDFVVFGEASTTMLEDNNIYSIYGDQPMQVDHFQDIQLEPLWAELEQKLML